MSITLTANKISPSLKDIRQKLDGLPREAYDKFVKDTPIRSGNARRKTKLSGNKIVAGYNYAKKLDDGFSKQAPDGMTKPTEDYIKRRVTLILQGK
jgi:hypothetical protein